MHSRCQSSPPYTRCLLKISPTLQLQMPEAFVADALAPSAALLTRTESESRTDIPTGLNKTQYQINTSL